MANAVSCKHADRSFENLITFFLVCQYMIFKDILYLWARKLSLKMLLKFYRNTSTKGLI